MSPTSDAANAAVGGEFLARALGTVLAARIGGPLVVSSDARSSDSGAGGGGEERLWVRQTLIFSFSLDVPDTAFAVSLPLSHSVLLSL